MRTLTALALGLSGRRRPGEGADAPGEQRRTGCAAAGSSPGRSMTPMRYDRCAHAFMSAICIAATVIFWL